MVIGKWMNVGTISVGGQKVRFGRVNASIIHSIVIVPKIFRRLLPGFWGPVLLGSGGVSGGGVEVVMWGVGILP